MHSLFETILNELNLTNKNVEPIKAQLRKVYNALNTEKEQHQQAYKTKSSGTGKQNLTAGSTLYK